MASKIIWGLYAADFVLRYKVPLYKKIKYSKLGSVSVAEGSDRIEELLNSGKPFMAARMGLFESAVMRMYEFKKPDKYQIVMDNLYNCAGFFPNDISLGGRFNQLMKEALEVTDVLGSNEQLCENYFINKCMPSGGMITKTIDVYDVCRDGINWSSALKGKKVLVVTPFTESVVQQYGKRERLFCNHVEGKKEILPKFELSTYKSLMTVGDMRDDRFADWFEALSFMEKEILAMDFDVALLGCGAYGFPLAAAIKRSGRTAIHMGGALQILFGIMGRRWDGTKECDHGQMRKDIARYYNEDWTYPIEERPKEADKVEYGPYWK